MDDGAMTRNHDLQMLVGTSFNANRLINDLGLCPRAFDAILIRRSGIESLDIQIENVCAIVGKTPGDAVVVANDNHRRAG